MFDDQRGDRLGYTKAVSSKGTRVSFPSVIAPATTDLLNGIFKEGPGYSVKVIGNDSTDEKLVGEAALQHMAARGFVVRQEKPADMHDLLLLTVIGSCKITHNGN